MDESNLVGNVFVVDRKINLKVVLLAIFSTFLIAFFKWILENEVIFQNFSLQEFTYSLMAATFILLIIKFNLIKEFFKEYFKFKFRVLIYLLFEILIVASLSFKYHNAYTYFLSFLFLFSGMQRIIIQKTKALFDSDMSKYMEFMKVYGYVRTAFFSLTILGLSKMITINLPVYWLLLLVVVLFMETLFLANLYPYCTKQKDIENTILILREIAVNKRIKQNQLIHSLNFSERFVAKQLLRLRQVNYIIFENKHIMLMKQYKTICEEKH